MLPSAKYEFSKNVENWCSQFLLTAETKPRKAHTKSSCVSSEIASTLLAYIDIRMKHRRASDIDFIFFPFKSIAIGLTGFAVFYFILPNVFERLLTSQPESRFYPIVEAVISIRIEYVEWIGLACLIAGLLAATWSYSTLRRSSRSERNWIWRLAKWLSRIIGD